MVYLELRPIAHPDEPTLERHRYAARIPLAGEYIHDGLSLDTVLRKVVKVSLALYGDAERGGDEIDAIVFYEEPAAP